MGAEDAAAELAHERAQAHPRPPGVSETEENLSIATSSLAALATAWAAFQAEIWSSDQTFMLARASRQRALSTVARLEGDQQVHLDTNLFVAWAGAYSEHNATLERFLYDRFPPRLQVATDAWLATKPLVSKDAPPHPFAMPEYEIAAHERAAALALEADDTVQSAEAANLTGDIYVFATVFLALVILLASLSTRPRHAGPRRTMLMLSAAALAGGLAWLATRPVSWPGH